MNRLIDILGELCADPLTRDAYHRDPHAFARNAGLTAAARGALARGDWQELERSLACGAWSPSSAWIDPGPDPLPDDIRDHNVNA